MAELVEIGWVKVRPLCTGPICIALLQTTITLSFQKIVWFCFLALGWFQVLMRWLNYWTKHLGPGFIGILTVHGTLSQLALGRFSLKVAQSLCLSSEDRICVNVNNKQFHSSSENMVYIKYHQDFLLSIWNVELNTYYRQQIFLRWKNIFVRKTIPWNFTKLKGQWKGTGELKKGKKFPSEWLT